MPGNDSTPAIDPAAQLWERLARAQRTAPTIPKTRPMANDPTRLYASEEDILLAVRASILAAGLVLTTSVVELQEQPYEVTTRRGAETWVRVNVKLSFRIVDPATGYSIELPFLGSSVGSVGDDKIVRHAIQAGVRPFLLYLLLTTTTQERALAAPAGNKQRNKQRPSRSSAASKPPEDPAAELCEACGKRGVRGGICRSCGAFDRAAIAREIDARVHTLLPEELYAVRLAADVPALGKLSDADRGRFLLYLESGTTATLLRDALKAAAEADPALADERTRLEELLRDYPGTLTPIEIARARLGLQNRWGYATRAAIERLERDVSAEAGAARS